MLDVRMLDVRMLDVRMFNVSYFRAMFSQFERQYSDFLRAHLTHLNIKEHQTSEQQLLAHINSHITTCTSGTTTSRPPNSVFSPALTKSSKSDDLARAHVGFAEELLEAGSYVLALSELCEAIKNSASAESLVQTLAVRISVLHKLKHNHECIADLRLLKSICCQTCLKSIFNSKFGRRCDQYEPILQKFGPIERCQLNKLKRGQIRKIASNQTLDDSKIGVSHNPPRENIPPPLVTQTRLSQEYNFVCNKVQLAQSADRGRFVVAKDDIRIGKISFQTYFSSVCINRDDFRLEYLHTTTFKIPRLSLS